MSRERLSKGHEFRSSSRSIQLPLMAPPTEEVTDVRILERLLDAATGILKENDSQREAKTFLLPLLFYKYLSDLSHTTSPEAMSLNFPPEYRWESISSRLTGDNIERPITNA